jgi:hypothetical protein
MLADLHLRLEYVAEAVAGAASTTPPAAEIWNELEGRLSANPGAYDPHGILSQDHLLLLGEVCQLSGECKFWWGVHA